MASWTFIDGQWLEGNPPIMGPMTHAPWLGSCVFDGARAFEGTAPDLDRHCERAVASALSFGLKMVRSAGEIEEIVREGIARFPRGAELYLRPMFWAESGFVDVDPESTRFSVSVYDSPLPAPTGFSVCLSPYRKPSYEYAPTDAKAACHYPNSARAIRDARARGFDNAVMLDGLGHMAELATANIWFAKDGALHTPIPNGTFLNGITRQRTVKLMRARGIEVHERPCKWEELLAADEVFSTGNHGKVLPVTRAGDRHLQPGPLFAKAREAYWEYAYNGA